jgi:uncharacterized RDD family membrane protein YckC
MSEATFRDRTIAQFLDGIILAIMANAIFFWFSGGKIYSVWISPMVPIFLMQINLEYLPRAEDWIWGGVYVTLSGKMISDIYLAYPSPLIGLVYGVYYSFFHYHYGQTPGKMMKGIVVLDEQNKLPTLGYSFYRWIGYVISLIPIGYGIWGSLIRKENRCYHDKFSKTKVFKFLSSSKE